MNVRLGLLPAVLAICSLLLVPASVRAGDLCDAPTVVNALPFADTVDTTTATSSNSDPVHSCTSATDARSVWYRFTAASSGVVTAFTTGTNYDTVITVYNAGPCASLNEIACNDDTIDINAQITFAVTASATYLIEVTELFSGAGGTLHFALQNVPPAPNDACSAATQVTNNQFLDVVDVSNATTDASDPVQSCSFDGSTQRNSVWYRFVAPSDGIVTLSTIGSSYDTIITAYSGSCGSLVELACNDDAGDQVLHSEIEQLAVTAGTTYLFEAAKIERSESILHWSVDFTASGGGSNRGIQLTPDGKRVLVNKDVGAERWAISRNEDGTVTGNVFRADGGAPAFIFCDPLEAPNSYSCSGADSCTEAGLPRGIQRTPDGKLVLVNKDVGAERWAISRNDDATVTGNVFRAGGGAPAFIFCQPLEAPNSFRCFGADSCTTELCTDQYTLIGDVTLPSAFFAVPDPCGSPFTFIAEVTLPASFFSPD